MHSDTFLLTPSVTICMKCFLDNTTAFSKINPGWKHVALHVGGYFPFIIRDIINLNWILRAFVQYSLWPRSILWIFILIVNDTWLNKSPTMLQYQKDANSQAINNIHFIRFQNWFRNLWGSLCITIMQIKNMKTHNYLFDPYLWHWYS